jgi:ABC-2 type transport system permease protein
VWLSGVYFKTLRDHRVGALAWGFGPGLLLVATLTQFEQVIGSPEARTALVALAQQFSWFEAPIGITRPGGFATFRLGPLLSILPAIWALLAASRTLRGEEERRMLDLVLATPLSRAAVVFQKLAALATALAVIAAVLGTLTWIGGVAARAEYGALQAYAFGLNVALTAAVFAAIALLVSQFVSERSTAAGITGTVLAVSFLLHSTSRVDPDLKWLGYLSPLYYAGLTKPLVPEVGISPGGIAVLATAVLVCASAAAWLFTRRDLGFAFRLPALRYAGAVPTTRARSVAPPFAFTHAWSLRTVFLRDLRTTARSAVWWAVCAAAYAMWMTGVGKQLRTNLTTIAQSSPLLAPVFDQLLHGTQGTALFIGMLVFSFVPLVIVAFAISHTARWAAEEEDGRTEMLLTVPISRPTALLTRFAAFTAVLTAICFAVGAGVFVVATATDLALEPVNLLAASLALVPVTLVVACLGALLAGWLRSNAVSALLTFYVIVSFVLVFVGPIFSWPRAILRLSVYDAYGSPLSEGWSWPSMTTLIAISVLLLAAATYRFARKDLAR